MLGELANSETGIINPRGKAGPGPIDGHIYDINVNSSHQRTAEKTASRRRLGAPTYGRMPVRRASLCLSNTHTQGGIVHPEVHIEGISPREATLRYIYGDIPTQGGYPEVHT